jgi:YhcH/YjgK/YiaL family protein
MILDKIDNCGLYTPMAKHLAAAFKFLQTANFDSLENGKIEIDGDNLFAFLSEYETKSVDESELEAHREYLDVQYMIKGRELIGYTPLEEQENSTEYSTENDLIFFKGRGNNILLEENSFAVFFPKDLHQPCIKVDNPQTVRKIVVKVKI